MKCVHIPVVVLLGDVDETRVCVGADRKEGGFPSQHRQRPDQVTGVRQEQGPLKHRTTVKEGSPVNTASAPTKLPGYARNRVR